MIEITDTELELIAKVAELEEQLSVQTQITRISDLDFEEKRLLKEINSLRATYDNLVNLVSEAKHKLNIIENNIYLNKRSIDIDEIKKDLIEYISNYEY